MAIRKKTSNVLSKNMVRRMIKDARIANAERKTYTALATGQTSTAAGTVFAITQGCIQGDSATTRDGSQINVLSIEMRMHAVVGVFNATLRVLLVQDTLGNGAVPAVLDLLNSASWLSNYAPVTQFEMKRFRILFDDTMDVSAAGPSVVSHNKKFTRLNHKITYLADTNVAGANGKNAVYLITIGSTTDIVYGYNISVQYLDQ